MTAAEAHFCETENSHCSIRLPRANQPSATVTPKAFNESSFKPENSSTLASEIKSDDQLPSQYVDDNLKKLTSGDASLLQAFPLSLSPMLLQASQDASVSFSCLPEWPTLSSPILHSPSQESWEGPLLCGNSERNSILLHDEFLINPLETENSAVEDLLSPSILEDKILRNDATSVSGNEENISSKTGTLSPSLGSMPMECLNPREDIQDLLDMGEALRMPLEECRQRPKWMCSEDGVVPTQEGRNWMVGKAKRCKRSSESGHQRGDGIANDHLLHLRHYFPSSTFSGSLRSRSFKARRGRRRAFGASTGCRNGNDVAIVRCAREAVAIVPSTPPEVMRSSHLTNSLSTTQISTSSTSHDPDLFLAAQLRPDMSKCNVLPIKQNLPPFFYDQKNERHSQPVAPHNRRLRQNVGNTLTFNPHFHSGIIQRQMPYTSSMSQNNSIYRHGRLGQAFVQRPADTMQLQAKGYGMRLQPMHGIRAGSKGIDPSFEVTQANAVSLTEGVPSRSIPLSEEALSEKAFGELPFLPGNQLDLASPTERYSYALGSSKKEDLTGRDAHGFERNHVNIDDVLMLVASRNSMLWDEARKRKITEAAAVKRPCVKKMARSHQSQFFKSRTREVGSKPSYAALPSTFCHLCTRGAKNEPFIICSNIVKGTCRKVTCFKCLRELPQDWGSLTTNSCWTCMHCRKVCPQKAQCNTYRRVNRNRRTRGRKADRKRNDKDESKPKDGSAMPEDTS